MSWKSDSKNTLSPLKFKHANKNKCIIIHSKLAMDAAYHDAGLQKICRVCGESLARAFRVYHECAEPKHAKNVLKVFGIDVTTDDYLVHPAMLSPDMLSPG